MKLSEILNAREERWTAKSLYARNEKRCAVSLTLRMPSELRLTEDAEKILMKGEEEVKRLLNNSFEQVSFKGFFPSADGPYAIFTVLGDEAEIKKSLVRFEEESRLGELIDADVMTKEGKEISRLSVGGKTRTCLVCGAGDARVCARSRIHTRENTIEIIGNILKNRLHEGE